MLSTTMLMLLATGIGLILIQFIIVKYAYGSMSKEEIKKLNDERKNWIKQHPFLTIILVILPAPISMILETIFRKERKDDREIHYPHAEKEIQYPVVQIGHEKSSMLEEPTTY